MRGGNSPDQGEEIFNRLAVDGRHQIVNLETSLGRRPLIDDVGDKETSLGFFTRETRTEHAAAPAPAAAAACTKPSAAAASTASFASGQRHLHFLLAAGAS